MIEFKIIIYLILLIGWVVRMRPNFRTNESPIYFLGKIYNGKDGKLNFDYITKKRIIIYFRNNI